MTTFIFNTTLVENKTKISYYPNPSSGFLYIQLTNATLTNYHLKLLNLLGQEESIDELAKQNDLITLNLHLLKKGIYFLQIFNDNKLIASEKVIKE